MKDNGRFVMGPGHVIGNHAYCGGILWDTEEMGPAPAMVTEAVRLLREGNTEGATDAMVDYIKAIRERLEGPEK